MDADKYPDVETAQAYLDELAQSSIVEEEAETTSPLLAALTTPV